MREYDIYLPSKTEQGRSIPAAAIARIKRRVAKAFGGYTHLSQQMEGAWKMGGVTFVEAVTVLRVLDEEAEARRISELKHYVQRLLQQKEVLIVERSVRLI
jgi:hypothetical protein